MAVSVRRPPAVKVPKLKSQGKPAHKPQPFNLYGTFRTQEQFNTAVRQRARQSYEPALREINAQRGEEESSHRGRGEDIRGYYGAWERNLHEAYEQSSRALNQMIATRENTSRASRAGLEAALNAADNAARERAAALGIAPTEGLSQGLNAAAVGADEGRANTLAGMAAGMIGAEARRMSLGSLGALQALRKEEARHTNVLETLRASRQRVTEQIPSYEETAREQIMQQLLAAQNQHFQQGLAGRQFGLQREQFGLDKSKFNLEQQKQKHQEAIDWANVQINQGQLENDRTRLAHEAARARTAEQKEAAQAKAKRWDSATSWLASYLAPAQSEIIRTSSEGGDRGVKINQRAYRRDYMHAFRELTTQFQLDPLLAYKLLATVTIPGWRRTALRDWGYISRGHSNEPQPLAGPPRPDNLASSTTTRPSVKRKK